MTALRAVLALAAVLLSTGLASSRQAPVPVTALGPQVGESTPAFRLPDQRGHTRTLAQVAGPKGTMVVFVRSADW